MENNTNTKLAMIAELTRSPHGKLEEYIPAAKLPISQDSEFIAHLISWNRTKGQVRDSKVALPILTLVYRFDDEYLGNSLAHLATLTPREFVRALKFYREARTLSGAVAGTPGRGEVLRRLVAAYLKAREDNWAWWERSVIQHRASMLTLYCKYRIKPGLKHQLALFEGSCHPDSTLAIIPQLKNMSATEAAGQILNRKIPFLVAVGALGPKAKEPDLVLALINQMSAAELINNTKMLERLGIKTNPALRGAYQKALEKAAGSKNVALLKASVAAEAVEDETLKVKLQAVQEKKIQEHKGIEGNWLVLADKSGSMKVSIETGKMVAGALTKMVKGKVHLVFFDHMPRYFDATGKTYEEIVEATKAVKPDGGTSIGAGLLGIQHIQEPVDGIAIVSDGGERHPPYFHQVYEAYCQHYNKQVPVYLYRVQGGDPDWLSDRMRMAGKDMQTIPVPSDLDYYSVPNLIQTMRTNRYGLVQEIYDTPLLDLAKTLPTYKGKEAAIA